MAEKQTVGDDIEVGAVEGELRYWLAKEAVRQGEGRLNAQAAIRTALEARATALTGWSAVSLLTAAGAVFTVANPAARLGASAAGIVLFNAAILGIHAVRPRVWSMVGYTHWSSRMIASRRSWKCLSQLGQGSVTAFRPITCA